MPNLDPKIRKHITMETTGDAETFFVISPIRWTSTSGSEEDGDMTALSVGTLNGKPRKERIAVLHGVATRVATRSSNLQSQMTETTSLLGGPATSDSQLAAQGDPVSNGHAVPPVGATVLNPAPLQSQPVSNGHLISSGGSTSIQPAPATDFNKLSLHDQPPPDGGPLQQPLLQQPLTNGGPPVSKPQNISLPPPPIDMERTKTDFFTPPSDPLEAKQLA